MSQQVDFPVCRWCNDTGVYSGPMLGSHYAGPCLLCPVEMVIGAFDSAMPSRENVIVLGQCHSMCYDEDGHTDGCLLEDGEW